MPADASTFSERFLSPSPRDARRPGAGITSNIPFGGDFSDSVILAEGYQMAPGESLISPYQVVATPGYLETMKIPLRSAAGSSPRATPRRRRAS